MTVTRAWARRFAGNLGRAGAALSLAVLLAAAVTCAPPTEIVVDVYTDVDCAKSPQTAIIAAPTLEELRERAPLSTSTRCAPVRERLGRVVLQPSGAKGDPIAFQVVTRNDDGAPETCTAESAYKGCIVARRRLRFDPGASTIVNVVLRLSCLDLPCDDSQTCVQGACVSASLPDACLGGTCDEPGSSEVGPEPSRDGGAPPDADAASTLTGDGGGALARLELPVPSADVRGLHALSTGLSWIEVPRPQPSEPVVRTAPWDALANATSLLTVSLSPAFGLAGDATGTSVLVAQEADMSCGQQHAQSLWTRVECPDGASAPFGAALDGTTAWLTGPLSAAIGGLVRFRFDSPLPPPAAICKTPSAPRYIEARGGVLHWADDLGVNRAVASSVGAGFGAPPPCVSTRILEVTGARGVAVDATGNTVCAGSPAGITCSNPVRTFGVPEAPTEDLAMREEAGVLTVYYATPSGIWRLRVN